MATTSIADRDDLAPAGPTAYLSHDIDLTVLHVGNDTYVLVVSQPGGIAFRVPMTGGDVRETGPMFSQARATGTVNLATCFDVSLIPFDRDEYRLRIEGHGLALSAPVTGHDLPEIRRVFSLAIREREQRLTLRLVEDPRP
jgi:hypothetical protein